MDKLASQRPSRPSSVLAEGAAALVSGAPATRGLRVSAHAHGS